MFKMIESKEEFFAAVRAGLLWGNYQTEEADPPQWEALEWQRFKASLIYDIWDSAEENSLKASPDTNEWQPHDFAVLVEDDGDSDG